MFTKGLFCTVCTSVLALSVLAATAHAASVPTTSGLGSSTATPHYGTWGFDTAGEDKTVKPGDDFFDYANGAYIKKTEIPADRVRFGNFDALSILSENRVHAILEDEAAHPGPTPGDHKIGALYSAFMDQTRIDQLGAAPLKADLGRVAAAKTKADLAAVMGATSTRFGAALFSVRIAPDAKDPSRYAVFINQSGLGLPDRNYYLEPSFAAKKAAYQAYVAKMLSLAGWPDADGAAKAILAYETQVAEASWTRVERRNRDKTYNPTTVDALSAAAPGFDYRRFLTGAELGQVQRVVVAENTAIPKLAAIYAQTPIETLKAWEAFTIIDDAAPDLSDPFVQARFDFRSHTLSGQPELQVRWKRAVATEDGVLGEAVGQIYVARYFPPESKAKMEQLVGNLKDAFHARIEKLTWMTPATKEQALQKLAAFGVKIGYPAKWKTYDFEVSPTDLYGDIERGAAWRWRYDVARLNKPVDRAEWGMTPQTVNAYYNATMNEIVFPAAILQPPFFDPKADPAINYGGIGGVIGHEMSHGFDDQGRKSDGTGKLRDWWTAEDATKFEVQSKKLGEQYSAFEPLPGAHVNGQLTMGENIGDMGGINLALDAYHHYLAGRTAPVIDGLTGDQRVFLGWAQVWRGKSREDALRQQLVTDPHSPPEERVNAVVRNVDGWYAAFDVKPGDKLYVAPADRVRIW
jgi:putative endopeptidase